MTDSLFSLSVQRPANTDKIIYNTIGCYLGKKRFKKFIDEAQSSTGYKIDGIVYSRIVIEVSKIDNEDYLEISLNESCFLPIAGKQLPIIERDAKENETSLIGYVDSLNFVLNDSRVYN